MKLFKYQYPKKIYGLCFLYKVNNEDIIKYIEIKSRYQPMSVEGDWRPAWNQAGEYL